MNSIPIRIAIACCAMALLEHAQAQAWSPSKPVEIVVGVAPGGGVDRTARFIQRIVQERRLVTVPVNVANRPGGGGTIAHTYVIQRGGDAHVWEISATSLLTNHIAGKTAIGHRDFTPVAMLFSEYLGFAVARDSTIRDARDLMTALRERADAIAIGIATTAGNTNHIAAGIIAKAAGADVKKLKVVVFSSGGESMTALLGGHVQMVVTPSANLIPHMESGRMRVLAVSAPQRLEGALSAAPTWKEHGVAAVVANWRPVIGARGWTPAQTAYWENVFRSVVATDEWRAEIARSGAVGNFMGSRELAAYLDEEYNRFRATLTDLGLAK